MPWIVEVVRMDPLQMDVLGVSGLFCVANAVFTNLSLRYGLPVFGYGTAVASMLAMALAVYYLNERLRLLHYWTFARQPFPSPVVVSDEMDAEL